MTRTILVYLSFLLFTGSALAEATWSGLWDVTWPSGGGSLKLLQDGDIVQGSYRDGRGRIEGKAQGAELTGQITQDGLASSFTATLSPDDSSFSGHTDSGAWLSGVRLLAGEYQDVKPDLSTPRTMIRSFLEFGNAARAGDGEAISWAADAVDFGTDPVWTSGSGRYEATQQIFDAIDLATFPLDLVPDVTDKTTVNLALPRLDQEPDVELQLQHGSDGKWRIAAPAPEALRKMAGTPQAADSFLQLQSPRDTLRAFLDGMANWESGGDSQAIATLDLSNLPDLLQSQQGRLTSQYLVRVIDRIGYAPLQSVPNSGASRQPFVYFKHPLSKITIVPVGTGTDTRWKFSADTVRNASRLFSAVQGLPEYHSLDPSVIPQSSLFAIRERVRSVAPLLVKDVAGRGRIEYWQLIAVGLVLLLMALMVQVFRAVLYWLFSQTAIRHHLPNGRQIALAMALGAALAIGSGITVQLGLPADFRQYTIPVIGTLLLLIVSYSAWHLIAAAISILQKQFQRAKKPMDALLLTFGGGVARLALLTGAGVALGKLWSVPTTGLIAGLGISGLAIAFASKEALSNVFGAGILLGDRPFRTGDRIVAEGIDGWVEEVGLRSTRVRTLDDSLMIVPNGLLADTAISNRGARRRHNFSTNLSISNATPEKLQSFIDAVCARINTDDKFTPDSTEVLITSLADGGVQLTVETSFKQASETAYRHTVHNLLLDILRLGQENGLSIGHSSESGEP